MNEQAAERSRAIRVIKYLLFSASIVPALAAGATAFYVGRFNPGLFLLAGLGLLVGQAGADYLYYYFTHYHTDKRDAHTKIFAGWRPLLIGRLLKQEYSLHAGIACLALDVFIGLYFVWKLGYGIALFALAGGLVAVFFTPLMLRGLKEPVIFFTFGPLCVLSVYYTQVQAIAALPVWASLPIGFLVTVVAYLKGARYEVKEENGETLILKMKPAVIAWLLALAYAALVASVLLGGCPAYILLGLLSLPFAGLTLKRIFSGAPRISDYLWATVNAILILCGTGALMALGFILSVL